MAKKKIRYFIFGSTLPADFPCDPTGREISFEAASIAHFRRTFREDIEGNCTPTLIAKEGSVEFGYAVVTTVSWIPKIDAMFSSEKFTKTRANIAFGDGDFGGAYFFVLAKPGKVKFPDDDTRKRIAKWMNRFWPKQDGELYSYIEIPMR